MKQTIALTSALSLLLSPLSSLAAQESSSAHSAGSVMDAVPPSAPGSAASTSPATAATASTAPSVSAAAQGSAAPASQAEDLAQSTDRANLSAGAANSPAVVQSSVPVPEGAAEIVSTLPPAIERELQAQALGTPTPNDTISSHGEQAISDGPEQCESAAQCGSRQSIGFTMMAWGAALAGLIGLIVWIGKPGHNPCCDSISHCCP
jgi:hypothetical protein